MKQRIMWIILQAFTQIQNVRIQNIQQINRTVATQVQVEFHVFESYIKMLKYDVTRLILAENKKNSMSKHTCTNCTRLYEVVPLHPLTCTVSYAKFVKCYPKVVNTFLNKTNWYFQLHEQRTVRYRLDCLLTNCWCWCGVDIIDHTLVRMRRTMNNRRTNLWKVFIQKYGFACYFFSILFSSSFAALFAFGCHRITLAFKGFFTHIFDSNVRCCSVIFFESISKITATKYFLPLLDFIKLYLSLKCEMCTTAHRALLNLSENKKRKNGNK